MLSRAALYYAAASVGGLMVGLTAVLLAQIGVADALGVAIKPKLELPWLYKLMVWGGIWGLIFLVPLKIKPLWLKALIFTIAPVLALFVYFVPASGGALFALDKGALAPVYLYAVNTIWGLVTAYLGRALGADAAAN